MISRFVAARGHPRAPRRGEFGEGGGGNSGGGNKRARGGESKPCCGAHLGLTGRPFNPRLKGPGGGPREVSTSFPPPRFRGGCNAVGGGLGIWRTSLTQMAKRPSYLRLFLTKERERERGTCTSGWRRHTAPSETNVSTNVKTRGEEAEERRRKGWRTRTTRFTTVQLDRAFTSFPFLNACVCVSTYRNGVYSSIQTRIVFRTVKWKQKATKER